MKITKRLLSMLMAIFLCLSLFPLSFPAKAETYGELSYEIIDGEVTITACKQNVSGGLAIPSVIEGYPVTKIDRSAFENCKSLTGVTIPESVTSIGNSAFAYCRNLQNVYFYGEAPTFGTAPFKNAGAALKVHYHTGNTGWENVTSYELTDVENQAVLTESEHFFVRYTYDNNHTCTTDGTERAVCLCCDALLIRKVEGTAAHRYVYTVNDDATCSADGTQTGTCILCGAAETVSIPGTALDHHYSDYVFDNNATGV